MSEEYREKSIVHKGQVVWVFNQCAKAKEERGGHPYCDMAEHGISLLRSEYSQSTIFMCEKHFEEFCNE